MRIVEIIVVYDVDCPNCSAVARELPDLLRVPVRVRSCRDPLLAGDHPTLGAAVRRCATPALGVVRRGGAVRWWPGLTGALGLLPVSRPGGGPEAARLLWTALRTRRPPPEDRRRGRRHGGGRRR